MLAIVSLYEDGGREEMEPLIAVKGALCIALSCLKNP